MKKYILFIVCGIAALQSCLDMKLDNQFSDPDAITTVATARELLASAYSSLPRYQFELSVLSDDFVPTNYATQYAEMNNLHNWQDNAIDDFSSRVWSDYYLSVAYLNTLLTRLSGVMPENDEESLELRKVECEAKALKALCYFDLLRFYAPPYSDEVLDRDGIILKDRLELDFNPRSSVRKCVEEIDRLLSEASAVQNESPVYYFGSDAIAALRAEFELYRGDYDMAVEYGLPLLSGVEDKWTEKSFADLWSENDSEERLFAPYIFDVFYIEMCYDRERGDYFALSDNIAYADGDVRKEWCEYQGPMAGARSLGKYNRMYYENTEVRYINTLRYSGVCFTVAEAYARDNAEDKAVELLDKYLEARGCDPVDGTLSGDGLVTFILAEKQKEFVGEGVRYFDIKRTGMDLKRYDASGKLTATIASSDYRRLFPIPQSEYKYNDNIKEENQNPGWAFEKTE